MANTTIPKTGSDKKNKNADKATQLTNAATKAGVDLSTLTPDQITQMQLEEAIKENQNPSMKLKKLKSPLSIKGCLINLAVFVVMSIVAGFLFLWLFSEIDTDTFSLGVVFKDVMDEFGISAFFKRIGDWFTGLFK